MSLDPLLLSRLQWVWVISWHILLPAFTVGLASYIAALEGLAFFTGKAVWAKLSGQSCLGKAVWANLSAFWTRIFAVSFGMGVVSGIVMPFQIGTNWSRFSDTGEAPNGATTTLIGERTDVRRSVIGAAEASAPARCIPPPVLRAVPGRS